MGQYPAVDILQSVSRLMDSIVSPAHALAARRMRAAYSAHRSAEDLINIGAYAAGSNPKIDKAIAMIDKINAFLIQPVGSRSSFEQTCKHLVEVAKPWDFLGENPSRCESDEVAL
jgi:flagellar biosynthesis/type III secretory pathway ATPase